MTPFLQLALLLAIIILTAKLAGYLSTRIGQPSVFGELLVGLILGPSLLNLIQLPIFTSEHLGDTVRELGEIGVLLLMFLAGIELHLSELAKNTRVSALAGVLGVALPVGLGYAIGSITGMDEAHALFLGLTMGATSVSISAQTLMELKVLRSRVGLGLLGAAVFDDILVILLLSSVLAIFSGASGFLGILWILARMILFLVGSVLVGLYLLPWISRKVAGLPISQSSLTLALVVMLLFGVAAEELGGMAAITGTFIAGLMFGRTPEKKTLERGMSALAYSFFVPIFFVDIGMHVNIRELDPSTFGLMSVIMVLAILGKIVGAGLGARLARFSWMESLQLGIGMVSRGEVGLIVASVGVSNDLLSPEVFSIIVAMVLVTTLVTPPMLRAAFSRSPSSSTPQDSNQKGDTTTV